MLGADVRVVVVPPAELLSAQLALQVEGSFTLPPVPQHVLRVGERLAAASARVGRRRLAVQAYPGCRGARRVLPAGYP